MWDPFHARFCRSTGEAIQESFWCISQQGACIWPNASKHFFLEWKIVFKSSFKYTVSSQARTLKGPGKFKSFNHGATQEVDDAICNLF